ncbi:MAG TPA: hypothetical protein VGL94_18970, partial [Ktedonobacteraceae bacterium]
EEPPWLYPYGGVRRTLSVQHYCLPSKVYGIGQRQYISLVNAVPFNLYGSIDNVGTNRRATPSLLIQILHIDIDMV